MPPERMRLRSPGWRAYAADWRAFAGWCADNGLASLPATPATLVLYPTATAEELATSTLARRLVAIAAAHRAAGHPTPTEDAGVRAVWRGIRRRKGTAQVGKAAAVTAWGVRDRALLLVGSMSPTWPGPPTVWR